MSESPSRESSGEGPAAKRRRVRKGTHSCWECRRRKIKCRFSSDNDTICEGCTSRGATCVSQEFTDRGPPQTQDKKLAQRLGRVEGLLDQLAQRMAPALNPTQEEAHVLSTAPVDLSSVAADDAGLPRPTGAPSTAVADSALISCIIKVLGENSKSSGSPLPADLPESIKSFAVPSPLNPIPTGNLECQASGEQLPQQHARVSRALHSLFPCQEDVNELANAGPGPYFLRGIFGSFNMQGCPHPKYVPEAVAEIPPVTSHPALLARRLMHLTICILQLTPASRPTNLRSKEPVTALAMKFAHGVMDLVASKDDLVGCAEGLETLCILTLYHSNVGNLRKAWLNCRRALSVAQMMGLQRSRDRPLRSVSPKPDPLTQPNASVLWFRIVQNDRYLSMILGMPVGTECNSFLDDPHSTPQEWLERTHAAVSLRIIRRGACMSSRLESDEAIAMMHSIDHELKRAAQTMGVSWWQATWHNTRPFLPASEWSKSPYGAADYLQRMAHLMSQNTHHHLTILCHLPYLMRDPNDRRWDYSKAVCLDSARELLRGFINFRRCQREAAYACRHVDYSALTAAMTLLLGYLEPKLRSLDEATARRRRADRQLAEQVRSEMQNSSDCNNDKLAREASQIIQRLLPLTDIEATGDGNDCGDYSSGSAVSAAHNQAGVHANEDCSLTIDLPSLGTISICPHALDNRGPPGSTNPTTTEAAAAASQLPPEPAVDPNLPPVFSMCPAIPYKPSHIANFDDNEHNHDGSHQQHPSTTGDSGSTRTGTAASTPSSALAAGSSGSYTQRQQAYSSTATTPNPNITSGSSNGSSHQTFQPQSQSHQNQNQNQQENEPLPSDSPSGFLASIHDSSWFMPSMLVGLDDTARDHQSPEMAAEADQWVLQGVEANFFENLLNSNSGNGGGGGVVSVGGSGSGVGVGGGRGISHDIRPLDITDGGISNNNNTTSKRKSDRIT